MKSQWTYGEINTNNQIPYQQRVSINSKPVLTGFAFTLSKPYYTWHSTTSSAFAFLKFYEAEFTK